ncbi:Oxysterol-binding protein- protein 9 [Goodea atripinnis]|uniref:Oxysterol-binding protein- protein 9 n=2 Tax=Goodeidae TaxID=28758 RepID=A0ABU7BQG8_9TELE|nr:Oxysterol-binding protein- protein 9 [Ataeniobius toweri]
MMRGSRRGCVRLRGAVIGIDDEDDSTFTITVDQKTFHFQARDADEREKWIHALEGTILRHTLQLRVRSKPPCLYMDECVSTSKSDLAVRIFACQHECG